VAGFYEIAYGPTATPTDFEAETMVLRLAYAAETFDLSSVSSYRRDNTTGTINVAGSSNAFEDFFASSGGRTWAQDVQASSKLPGMFNGMVGASYSRDQSYNDNRISGFLVANLPGITSDNTVTTHSYSAFGEAYFTPLERLKLTLGLRYTKDKRRYEGKLSPIAAAVFNPADPTAINFGNGKSFSEFTPRVVLAYDLDTLNIYASWNRGFKEGGYNTPSFANVGPVDPEKVDYFETGAKYVSEDRRLRLNAAAFYYKYRDIQVTIVNVASGQNVLQNAAAARAYGLEFGGSFTPQRWLNLFADVALLDSEFTAYPNASISIIAPTGITSGFANLKGTRLPRAPSFQASFGANLQWEVAEDMTAHLNFIGRYTSSYDFYPGANGPQRYARQDGYALFNVSGYLERQVDDAGSGGLSPKYYRVGFFINNATDKKYFAVRVPQPFIGLMEVAAPARTYGLRLSAGF
jgi:iron complex outermembrane receptor protein